ncbi:hypothetical protein C2845_PM11G04420 [Panicum miliaceum]|uniref:Uncharacterized protein n=1 Tax=Panicum miliaceum TaxID=4540 RepID=A0A3L6RQQ2_PANMI|nr:hypothetical protein C2845_PM11G04420 [Panicum miliaceum]
MRGHLDLDLIVNLYGMARVAVRRCRGQCEEPSARATPPLDAGAQPLPVRQQQQFLNSSAWNIIADHGKDPVPFALPVKCHPTSLPCLKDLPCPSSLINVEEEGKSVSPSFDVPPDSFGNGWAPPELTSPSTPVEHLQKKIAFSPGPWSKNLLIQAEQTKLAPLLEDLAKRRSKRDCLGCSITPSALCPSVIKNLGVTFCNLDEEKLSNTTLAKKKKTSAPGGKNSIKKKPSDKNGDDDKHDKKKPRK